MNTSGGASSLKEREIIEIIWESITKHPEAPVSYGDDASAVELQNGLLAVLTVDMLVGRTDVPKNMSLYQAARKAVVMNISDLASKGVEPLAVLCSLGLPRGLSRKDIAEIGRGLNDGAREYGAYIIGGDTNEADDLIIDSVAFGLIERDLFVSRGGAKPGDIVATTGVFGKIPCGFKIIYEELDVESELREKLLEPIYYPKARVKEGVALSRGKVLSASIDSSDGLAWSLHEISRASGVGFLIRRLPIADEAKVFAEKYNLDLKEICLYGGEEYELVLTIKPEKWVKAKSIIERLGSQLIKIGVATEERSLKLEIDGEEFPIEPRGWEHFNS